ncbi:MAG: DUF2520 domain-containing protein [Bacteroidota bacterium]|nr:DUF2520 domain-containing protein [Bacteroidota bacterium]
MNCLQPKISVTIIGAGNVAFHLMNVLTENEKSEVKQLYNRSGFTSDFQHFKVDKITDLSHLKPSDICIIAVKDEAISEISEQLPFSGNLVVHTSGNTSVKLINNCNRRGVFYPLQSFSKTKPIDFQKVPICIEAENDQDYQLLKRLASIFTDRIYQMDSHQRKMLHIAAVFANNFTNHLIEISYKICEKNHIPTQILAPLIDETFEKLQKLSPYEAQTGPAKRGDMQTLKSHFSLLDANQKEIYKIITNSILDTYGKEKL